MFYRQRLGWNFKFLQNCWTFKKCRAETSFKNMTFWAGGDQEGSRFEVNCGESKILIGFSTTKLNWIILPTGWPKSKVATLNGCNSESMHFWPYVDKAKMGLGGVSLFSFFSCLFTIFSCLFTISQIKLTPPKHFLALPT